MSTTTQAQALRQIAQQTMNVPDGFRVRTMRRDEVALAIDLAAREGWNPGLHDAESFYLADTGGFLVGELNGDPVGCIAAVSYAGRYGIHRPLHRSCRAPRVRLRTALVASALDRLGGHNVGLDGVVAQQRNYAKSGFRLAYRNIRYRGKAAAAPTHRSIMPAANAPFSAIGELDRNIFPERRDGFLRHWLTQPMSGAFVAHDAGRLTGYTVVRKVPRRLEDRPVDGGRCGYGAASVRKSVSSRCPRRTDLSRRAGAESRCAIARGIARA
jgi:hypothetical protein